MGYVERVGVTFLLLMCTIMANDHDDITEPGHHCVCKPTMKLSMEGGPDRPICNNATFDWLLHTVLAEVSQQKDIIAEKEKALQDLHERLAKTESLADKIETKEDSLHEENARLRVDVGSLQDENRKLKEDNIQLLEELEHLEESRAKANPRPRDCADVQRYGFHYTGIYTIYPARYDMEGIEVFCDLNTDHGGWLVLQRRQDGSERFDRSWETYKWGFGKAAKEFYLGNEFLFHITHQRNYELRVDITDLDGKTGHAMYESFYIENEENKYKLHIGNYQGNAGDALSHHDNYPFSTKDVDNDDSRSGHCSQLYGSGGWWYVRCYDSNLNGVYTMDREDKAGIIWFQWKDKQEPLRHVEMKIRPVSFGKEQH